jgi:uncharacterized protein
LDNLEILGYICSILIGISLGLIGSGGSILTVPVLVYLMNIHPVQATAYSLFVVGCAALVGALKFMKRSEVDYKTGILFAIPSFIAVFITRKYIVPAIPDHITSIGSLPVTKDIFIMIAFALMMIAAAIAMVRPAKRYYPIDDAQVVPYKYSLIVIEGFIVGILTGFVGAGGGFLIIPALVLLAKVPMKTAIGTSLMIIAAKSLIGFMGDVSEQPDINWKLLSIFTLFAIGGIFIGMILIRHVPGTKLKPAFGWFVFVMAFYIIARELIF